MLKQHDQLKNSPTTKATSMEWTIQKKKVGLSQNAGWNI